MSLSGAGTDSERLPRLSSRLILLVEASILPVLVLSGVLGYFLIQHEEQLFRQAAIDRNRSLLTALDAQIEGYAGTLRALAASSSLESGDLAAFYAESKRVLASQPDWRNILLIDRTGQQIINLRLPYGAALPREEDPYLDSFRAAVSSRKLQIGSLAPSPVSSLLGIAVRLPILQDGRVKYVLQFVLDPQAMEKLLALQGYPPSWTIGLVDANTRIIAGQPFRMPGAHSSAVFAAAIARSPEGWYRGKTLEGRDSYTAHGTSRLTNWAVGVAIPTSEINAVAYRAATYMLVGTAISLLLATLFAYWAARRLAEPIAQLATAARHLGERPVSAALTNVRTDPRLQEVLDVASALEEAESSMLERENLRHREQQALRAADKAKDEFLAMLGHELRNPLSAIVASAHVLRLSKPDAQAVARAHQVIERQARQMARLVEDLLDVSRLAMGKLTLQRERMDLALLTERVLSTWAQTRQGRAERTKSNLSPTWVDADRARLEQILTNLLDNAEKFSPRGGPIHVRISSECGKAIMQVQDEGQGIAAENITRVFDLFVQGPQPLDRPHGGIGLGLTLVKRFTEMHGGSIGVSSPGIGKGSVFTVYLPLVDGPGAAPVAADPVPIPQTRRVLLVEDNEDGRLMMATMLELEGHSVKAVSTGEAALRVALDWPPHIALIDIGLPDIDGYVVAQRLRALLPSNTPKLIALSGFGQQNDLHSAYEAGFDLHLTKPVSPQFLRDVMSALTSRQQTTSTA